MFSFCPVGDVQNGFLSILSANPNENTNRRLWRAHYPFSISLLSNFSTFLSAIDAYGCIARVGYKVHYPHWNIITVNIRPYVHMYICTYLTRLCEKKKYCDNIFGDDFYVTWYRPSLIWQWASGGIDSNHQLKGRCWCTFLWNVRCLFVCLFFISISLAW